MDSLTSELIENTLVEDASFDFKVALDLDAKAGKVAVVDDVVAFLNRGEARILIGVDERGGRFHRYAPMSGDPDAQSRRLLSVLQDNIAPKPLDIDVNPVAINGGHMLDIRIPEHRLRPYQNRITGAFLIRTGSKNTPLDREQVRAAFVPREQYEADILRLADVQNRAIERRALMLTDGAILEVAVLPQAHYEREHRTFSRGQGLLRSAPSFHDDFRGQVFSGCEGGHEALQVTLEPGALERIFIGNDWFIHAHVVHPIASDHERVRLPEFKTRLSDYLEALQALLDEERVLGPVCTLISLRALQRGRATRGAFPRADQITQAHPMFAEKVFATELIDDFYQLVRSTSVYGG